MGNSEWDGPCLAEVDASAVCTGESAVSIFDTVTVVLSTNSPRLLATGTFGIPGLTISLTQGTNLSRTGLIIADSNTNADGLGSNPMPAGTTIAFSVEAEGITTLGATSFTVPNTTAPTGPYGVTLQAAEVDPADPLPLPGLLLLTITPPNATPTQISWGLQVLR